MKIVIPISKNSTDKGTKTKIRENGQITKGIKILRKKCTQSQNLIIKITT